MLIIAGGDSFIWGSELRDCFHGNSGGHSRQTFTALLAGNNEYQCAAYPGNGNDSIARMTMIACEQNRNKQIFVVVCWTFAGRYEFKFNFNNNPKWEVINSWSIGKQYTGEEESKNSLVNQHKDKADKLGIGEFAKSYFASVGFTEYWETYSSIKEVIYLQNYLKSNQIPYLFTCADSGFLKGNYTINHPDVTIDCLYKQIDWDKFFFFPPGIKENETKLPRGFYQWALENKYRVGDTHPLEEAHLDASKLIKEKFDEMVTQSI